MGDGAASSFGLGADRRRVVGVTLSIAIVLTIALLAVLGGGDGETEAIEIDTAPRLVDPEEISKLADSLGHPLYWAGPQEEAPLELTQGEEGSVYLRYLTADAEVGDPRPQFLTVGTYPVVDPVAALSRIGAKAQTQLDRAGDAALLVNPEEPNSVYLAYPDSELQIEVYDPEPGRALELIRSGAIEPVE